MNQQTLEGNWNEIKGKLRKKWGQLTDKDLPEMQGNIDQLAGIIQRKTGERRDAIESYLREVGSGASSTVSGAADAAREYAQKAIENVEQASKQAMDQIRAGYMQSQRLVRDQPGISLGVCFGVGVLAGLLLGLTLRGR